MKKTLLYSIILSLLILISAQVKCNTPQSVDFYKSKTSVSDVWTNPTGMDNNMTVYATVYKNGAVYEPDGLLLGVFKGADAFCYGYDTWLVSNSIKLHMVLVMSNDNNTAGYKFKAYNPTTNQYFDFNETFSFVPDADYGSINAPKILNIVESAVEENKLDNSFIVYQSAINDSFNFILSNQEKQSVKIDLYDLKGIVVQHLYDGIATTQITCQKDKKITMGIYFVKANVGTKSFVKKVIVN